MPHFHTHLPPLPPWVPCRVAEAAQRTAILALSQATEQLAPVPASAIADTLQKAGGNVQHTAHPPLMAQVNARLAATAFFI